MRSRRSRPPLPRGRGREAMTYGCAPYGAKCAAVDGAAVSHAAELVRGDFLSCSGEGPLIRPLGTFSPRGEGSLAASEERRRRVLQATAISTPRARDRRSSRAWPTAAPQRARYP